MSRQEQSPRLTPAPPSIPRISPPELAASSSSSSSFFRGRPSAMKTQQHDTQSNSSPPYSSFADRDVSPTSSYHSAGEGERDRPFINPSGTATQTSSTSTSVTTPFQRLHIHDSPLPFQQQDAEDDASSLLVTCHPPNRPPSFVFVCLGVGGGPLENDCSCYMVKPAGRDWRQGSFVLEGGSWLGALSKLCDPATNSPAFSDFPFTHSSPSIRAGEIGSHAKAFLITHAHLDHILGMVLGSASLPGKRAVYGLRSTLDNLLGIFDGKLWPKLASLDDNAPFIVYHCRPIECQKTIHLDETISVLPFALSHGLNMSTVPEPPTPAPQPLSAACYFSKRYSLPLNSLMGASPTPPLERALPDSGGSPFSGFNRTTFTSPFAPDRSSNAAFAAAIDMERSNSSSAASSPRIVQSEMSDQATSLQAASRGPLQRPAKSRRPKTASGSEKAEPPVSDLQPIISNDTESSDSPESAGGRNGSHPSRGSKFDLARDVCNGNGSAPGSTTTTTTPHHHTHTGGGATMDSTAFFLTNKETGQEVLFFGDVEPDCVSRSPRNRRVWQHAASRFAVDRLNTVFLECSFPAAQPTEFLWGHLSTSHLYDELKVLARCVKSERAVLARTERTTKRDVSSAPPRMVNFSKPLLNGPLPVIPSSPLGATSHSTPADLHGVLKGLTVIVIHAKQAFFPSYSGGGEGEEGSSGTASSPSSSRKGSRVLDPRTMQERILQELEEMEEENGLGVRFVMSKQGMRIEI